MDAGTTIVAATARYRVHRGPDQIPCRTPTLAEEVTPSLTILTLLSLSDLGALIGWPDCKLLLKL